MDERYALYLARESALKMIEESFGLGETLPVERCLEVLTTCRFNEPRRLIERRIGTDLDEIEGDCLSGQVMIETQLILQEAMAEHRQQVRAEESEPND